MTVWAFPFVTLGILTMSKADSARWLADWAKEVAWKLPVGVLVGAALGFGLVFLNRLLPKPLKLSSSRSAMAAIGITFLIYAISPSG